MTFGSDRLPASSPIASPTSSSPVTSPTTPSASATNEPDDKQQQQRADEQYCSECIGSKIVAPQSAGAWTVSRNFVQTMRSKRENDGARPRIVIGDGERPISGSGQFYTVLNLRYIGTRGPSIRY